MSTSLASWLTASMAAQDLREEMFTRSEPGETWIGEKKGGGDIELFKALNACVGVR